VIPATIFKFDIHLLSKRGMISCRKPWLDADNSLCQHNIAQQIVQDEEILTVPALWAIVMAQ
jgi:hypothetical protein